MRCKEDLICNVPTVPPQTSVWKESVLETNLEHVPRFSAQASTRTSCLRARRGSTSVKLAKAALHRPKQDGDPTLACTLSLPHGMPSAHPPSQARRRLSLQP